MKTNYSTNEENRKFIEKFNPEKFNFTNLVPYIDVAIGFSVKKKLNKNDKNNITSLGIYIADKDISDKELEKKPLNIKLVYGRESKSGGIELRQNIKLFEPVDVNFPNEYYYNVLSGEFFKKNKKIEADQILNQVYAKHIKSTKLIKGFFMRTKIWIFRVLLTLVFRYISKLFSLLIRIISGNVYKYGFEEHINKRLNIEKRTKVQEPIEKPEEKISFLGYNATPACILFYSSFHFVSFVLLYVYDFKSNFLSFTFNNAFLTLVYVMMSLVVVDKILPMLFKKVVDGAFELSVYFSYKTIKL